MKNLATPLLRVLAAVALAGSAGLSAADPAPIANWSFSEAAATSLNLTANSGSGLGGAGGTWDVAIAGVATTGSGLLAVRNAGGGGSGTRTAYADFGPVPAAVSSGTLSLYASFASWDLSGAGANGPRLSLALVEGNDFTTAQFSLAASAAGLTLSGSSDAFGNGSNIAQTAQLAASGSQPFSVRVSVDLDAFSYSLALDSGSGYVVLGSAGIDTGTSGINSLRLSLSGDFSIGGQAGRGLLVDRIWVVEGPVTPVPEPHALLLALGGLAVVAARAARAKPPRKR
jgi:hypothetical protein